MKRFDIINSFIQKYDLKSYLEIGTQNRNQCFNNIKCDKKLCIDPDVNAAADYILTSDEFFEQNKENFDIVFIDGMHEGHQVYRDIQNSLKFLNKGGVIICHDCNPMNEARQIHYSLWNKTGEWCGDAWKGFVKYRFESNYKCYLINEDEGCGIIDTNLITKVEKKFYDIDKLTYKDLETNREFLLGY